MHVFTHNELVLEHLSEKEFLGVGRVQKKPVISIALSPAVQWFLTVTEAYHCYRMIHDLAIIRSHS